MNTESFLSLRTFKKFFVFLSLVKVFFLFLGFVFFFIVLCQLQAVVYLRVTENLYITVMALVGFSTSAGVPKWGLFGVAEQKGVWRTVLYNGFRFVLGYRNWPTLNTQWRRLS